MKKLITPLLVFAAMLGGFLAARQLDAQVIWSPRQGIHFTGTVDPTAGLGLVAAEGTIYVRTGATDGLYVKTGSGNTAWTAIALSGGAASFSSVTATGNVSAVNVSASGQFLAANGSAGAPSYSFTNSPTSGRYRTGADTYQDVTAGIQVSGYATGVLAINGAVSATQVALSERTDPGGSANVARLYAADNASKTEVRVIFGTGAAAVIEAEP